MSKLYSWANGPGKRLSAFPSRPELPTVMIAPERLAPLQTGWMQLLARHDVAPDAAYPTFDRLVELYSAPERFYHNLEHIAEMFRVVGRLAPTIDDLGAVQLAIWFHDAVHDTRARDNEERSAALAAEWLGPLGMPSAVIHRVAELVRATAHLTSSEAPSDRDTAALLDADLAILGAAPERYARYARDIRSEYHWVPELEYRQGRAAVLRRFLARPRIYSHQIIFEEGEERARNNIAAELKGIGDPGIVSPTSTL
jgi:predicted metal-dependent HD superfamily phosphohydrolase